LIRDSGFEIAVMAAEFPDLEWNLPGAAEHAAIGGDTRRGRATAAHALNTRLLEEIVRPRGEGTPIAVFSPIRGID
jgi:hypothetical protein